jgi:hypothetical protein
MIYIRVYESIKESPKDLGRAVSVKAVVPEI